MKYLVNYTEEALEHLAGFTAFDRVAVVSNVDKQLTNHPLMPSKNCKQMRENPLAQWRLRVGKLRIFFNISDDEKTVFIKAIGIKIKNRVLIAGEEIQL